MGKWTFVTNHAVVLTFLAKHPSITARQLALEIGITERAVRTIISDLEAEGYMVKAKEGRRVRYSVKAGLPLRHSTQLDKQVGQLLNLLGSVGKPLRKRSSRKS
jgi:predicted ArsR family transcriptional regulator